MYFKGSDCSWLRCTDVQADLEILCPLICYTTTPDQEVRICRLIWTLSAANAWTISSRHVRQIISIQADNFFHSSWFGEQTNDLNMFMFIVGTHVHLLRFCHASVVGYLAEKTSVSLMFHQTFHWFLACCPNTLSANETGRIYMEFPCVLPGWIPECQGRTTEMLRAN